MQGILGCLNKIPVTEILSGLETWKSEYFSNRFPKKHSFLKSVKNKLLILSKKTEKDEIYPEILEDRSKGGTDLIIEGNNLVNRLDKLSQIPMELFKRSIDDAKLSFNDLLIKSMENNFYQIHLPNILSSPHIDSLFNELMELTEELQSKKESLSISVECQEKRCSPLLIDASKTPISNERFARSPRRNYQKIHIDGPTSAFLSFNQTDLSCDSVKTVKRNLSNSNHHIKLDSVSLNTNLGSVIDVHDVRYPETSSSYYPLLKASRKTHHESRPTSVNVGKNPDEIANFTSLQEEASTPQTQSKTNIRKHSLFEKNIMKKQSQLAKLKIPEKYKQVFEELKNDRLEQIDLSNAGFSLFWDFF